MCHRLIDIQTEEEKDMPKDGLLPEEETAVDILEGIKTLWDEQVMRELQGPKIMNVVLSYLYALTT